MKTSTKKRLINSFALVTASAALVGSTLFNRAVTVGTHAVGGNEYIKAVPIFDTMNEATEAARDLNEDLEAEGAVLLKNDGTLPLAKGLGVTVFSGNPKGPTGGFGAGFQMITESLPNALREDGFKVFSSTLGVPNPSKGVVYTNFSAQDLKGFNDVGIVLLGRGGGEGNDLDVVRTDLANEEENVGGWKHSRLAVDGGKERRHNQMLDADEIAMIEFAKKSCKSVIVLLNTSNAMEMYNLEHDDDIGAIMFVGRPGTTGVNVIGDLLNGTINPSGKTSDIWFKDFTADPTWFNSIANKQNDAGSNEFVNQGTKVKTGLHSIDYEEDIFLGYAYYETVYAEILAGRLKFDPSADKLTESLTKGDFSGLTEEERKANADAFYASAVVYPFGYGLSYSDFDIGAPQIVNAADFTVAKLNSGFVEGEKNLAETKELEIKVKVTNKGRVSGKTAVQLYVEAPYDPADASKNTSKSAVKLVGFGKTRELLPGTSQTLKISVNTQDIAYYSANESHSDGGEGTVRGAYVLDAGDYKFYAAESSHCFDDRASSLNLPAEAVMALDDFSNELVQNVFSEENGRYYTTRKNNADWNGDGVIDDKDISFNEEMVIMDRSDLVGTFPKAPVTNLDGAIAVGGLSVTQQFLDLVAYYTNFNLESYVRPYSARVAGQAYAVGDLFAGEGDSVYRVTTAIPAVPALNGGSTYAVGDVVLSGGKVYQFTKAITEAPEFRPFVRNQGPYEVGEYVSYNGNYYVVKTRITGNTNISTSGGRANVTAYNPLVTSGDDANVVDITNTYAEGKYEIAEGIQNTYSYKYTDKLINGLAGRNQPGQSELYDVKAEQIAGWTQMADANAQKAAMEAENSDWIMFNELAGIYYDSEEVIASGRFAGKTGVQVWTQFMNQWTWQNFETACWQGGNNGQAVANLGIPNGGVADGPNNFNSTYAWCCNTTIASTWNVDLVEYQGELVASLGLLKNASNLSSAKEQWLNPAVNTHRTPFSGRNNEYYSQDGIHAGILAAACAKGIQSRGVGCHLKHMALNDQETDRNTNGNIFVWVSERAAREIYLKPFQMGIQEGGAEGAMSAFARFGSVPTAVNRNLFDVLVRQEWGAPRFFAHPDMYSPQSSVAGEDLMVRTGHNHAPGGKFASGNSGTNSLSGWWDAEVDNPLTGTKGGVMVGRDVESTGQKAYLSNNQWYAVRLRAMQMYSEYANQGHSRNGYLLNEYVGDTTLLATQGTKITNIDVSIDADVEFENYVISSGSLPAGLTLNENTGIISGTPTESGTFDFKIKATLDKWITQTNSYRITVSTTGLAAGQVGVNYQQDIISDKSGTFSVSEGALPAGLTLNESNGRISGTPTEAGSFEFKIAITDGENVNELPLSIVIAPQTPVDHGGILSVEKIGTEGLVDTYKITFADETTFEFTVTNGAQGEQGPQGEAGAQGPQGPQGEQGIPGKDGADGKDGKDGAQGPQGPQGEQGPQGPQGPAGADGKDGVDGKDGADAKGCNGSIVGVSGIMAVLGVLAVAVAASRKIRRKED